MPASLPTSLTLLDRLAEGDAPAWGRLLTLYAPLFRSWLRPRGVQPADVDDLTQNAARRRAPPASRVRTQRPHRGFPDVAPRIVGNVLRDHLRAADRGRRRGPRLDEVENPAAN